MSRTTIPSLGFERMISLIKFAVDSRRAVQLTRMESLDWLSLLGVLALAVTLRLLFYTGFFGSDEVTYVETAVNIAAGDWRAQNYIGATRYGMNLPVALAISIFGISEASGNLWPFICSVGEVAIVFIVARWLWTTRAAILSAGLLAVLPLHVHFAGRMMADPPLALFLTLSVVLLLRAAWSKNRLTYLAAGLAWGGVFWVKESVALLYLPVFLVLHSYLTRINSMSIWLIAGMALTLAANCVLMYFVAGNPLHVFAVMRENVATYVSDGFAGSDMATSPSYYFRYLFLDIRHTFLLGILAAGGMGLYLRQFKVNKAAVGSVQFVFLWATLIVGLFSFAVVSFAPLKLVSKQTNYILIFAGPLTLLAGRFLASLSRRMLIPLIVLVATGSIGLAALEQQAVAIFTANSRAAYRFLADHPNTFLVATTNNVRAVNFYSLLENRLEFRERIMSFGDLAALEAGNSRSTLSKKTGSMQVFALFDLQNIDWGNKPGAIRRISDVPKCWKPLGELKAAALGRGRFVTEGLVDLSVLLPEYLSQRYLSILQPVVLPLPARLFAVDKVCLSTSDNP